MSELFSSKTSLKSSFVQLTMDKRPVTARVNSRENLSYKSKGDNGSSKVKIFNEKLEFSKNARATVGSFDNLNYKNRSRGSSTSTTSSGGLSSSLGSIATLSMEMDRVQARVNSLDNLSYRPRSRYSVLMSKNDELFERILGKKPTF